MFISKFLDDENQYADTSYRQGRSQQVRDDGRPKIFNPNLMGVENVDASLKLGLQVGKQ